MLFWHQCLKKMQTVEQFMTLAKCYWCFFFILYKETLMPNPAHLGKVETFAQAPFCLYTIFGQDEGGGSAQRSETLTHVESPNPPQPSSWVSHTSHTGETRFQPVLNLPCLFPWDISLGTHSFTFWLTSLAIQLGIFSRKSFLNYLSFSNILPCIPPIKI